MDETQKYDIIKKLVDTNGNKQTAALKLGRTIRTVNRMIAGYHQSGKAFFSHGNHNHQPVTTIPQDTKQTILDLYHTKYYNCNLTHYSELLEDIEHIEVSVSTISSILRKGFILSPKAHRSSKKAVKKELKPLQSKAKSKKQVAAIQSSILDLEDAHPRRPHCAYFGEMLQMDASDHLWFGNTKSQLHIDVDDATGKILGAYFDS